MLWDILRLPSSRRASLGLYVILTLWRGRGANQPPYALLHSSSPRYIQWIIQCYTLYSLMLYTVLCIIQSYALCSLMLYIVLCIIDLCIIQPYTVLYITQSYAFYSLMHHTIYASYSLTYHTVHAPYIHLNRVLWFTHTRSSVLFLEHNICHGSLQIHFSMVTWWTDPYFPCNYCYKGRTISFSSNFTGCMHV